MKRRSDIASVPGARWPLGSLPPCRGLGLSTRSLAHRAIALRRPPVSRLLGTQGTRRRSRGPLGSPVPSAGLRASSTHRPAFARGVGPWHRPRADAGQPRAERAPAGDVVSVSPCCLRGRPGARRLHVGALPLLCVGRLPGLRTAGRGRDACEGQFPRARQPSWCEWGHFCLETERPRSPCPAGGPP